MSSFRAPQVPQQPPQYFTPGQPLGIPKARTDDQFRQYEAYYRPRPDNEALQLATHQYPGFKTVGIPLGTPNPLYDYQVAARWPVKGVPIEILSEQLITEYTPSVIAFVPASLLPIVTAPRWPIEPLVNAIDQSNNRTAGTPLGVPNPIQTDQTQALWRVRVEIQQPQSFAPQVPQVVFVTAPDLISFETTPEPPPQQMPLYQTAGLALGAPPPRQSDQAAAYFRPRPDTEALEEATGVVDQPATAGTALGIPQPVQGNQAAAYFRPRPDTEALEEALGVVDQPLTAGIALGIPNPVQTDQTQATWRAHIDIPLPPQYFPWTPGGSGFVPALPLQLLTPPRWPVEPLINSIDQANNFTPGSTFVFVPSASVPYPASSRWALEWIVENYWPEFTPGQPLGVPPPRQSDQSAAYQRPHVEIIQPAAAAVEISGLVVSVPYQPLLLPPTAQRQALEPLLTAIDQADNFTPTGSGFIPALPLQLLTVPRAENAPLIAALAQYVTPTGSGFIPAPAPQMMAMTRQELMRVPTYQVPSVPVSVPPSVTPTPLSQRWELEWILGAQQSTAGQPTGVPVPRRDDQVAALWRYHIDIPLPPMLFIAQGLQYLPPRGPPRYTVKAIFEPRTVTSQSEPRIVKH